MTGHDLQQIIEQIPTPVDQLGPCRAYLTTDGQDAAGRSTWRVYFARDGGRWREPVGPVHLSWAAASQISHGLNERAGLLDGVRP